MGRAVNMRVSSETARKFNSLYTLLLYYAGQERKVLPSSMNLDDFKDGPLGLKIRCRDAIYEPIPLIGRFLQANGELLTVEAQATLALWADKHMSGTFAVLRHLKKYSVFLAQDGSGKAYGVLGLTEDLGQMIPKEILPSLVKTVLLPFEGAIVCDGIVVAAGHVTLDVEDQKELNAQYAEIKRTGNIITSLE
jgi:hypothetical protein